jgi:hypothetical protein
MKLLGPGCLQCREGPRRVGRQWILSLLTEREYKFLKKLAVLEPLNPNRVLSSSVVLWKAQPMI